LQADFAVLSLFYADVVTTKGFKLQRLTTHQAEKIAFQNHVASLDLHDQVRFASLRGYGASAYLTVYPDSDRPRSIISSDNFRYAYRLRFGLAPVDGLVRCVYVAPRSKALSVGPTASCASSSAAAPSPTGTTFWCA
jgi:hypothetical protein